MMIIQTPKCNQYILNSMGFIIMYSIDKRLTFDDVTNIYLKQIENIKEGLDNQSFIVVGNKCDLESERTVSREELDVLGMNYGCSVFETSVKFNVRVREIFYFIAKEVIKRSSNVVVIQKSKKRGCLVM